MATRNRTVVVSDRATWERRAFLRAFEEELAACARLCGDILAREYRAIPGRRFRLDYAVPRRQVGIEVQGYFAGGHHGVKSFALDCEKLSLHTAHGWRVLPVTYRQIRRGAAIRWTRQALGLTGRDPDDGP